ncbi:MAG TPA: tetratricopeptide repeat protein [Thermoanaerobaculia bacterium]|nr:tetratricopeptide repeat protein [Thermoanaerobaculia bacterium]
MAHLALLLDSKSLYVEAEPLIRRALAIYEITDGSAQSGVAVCLNNLATLLQNTNRLSEAEPMMRRALERGCRTATVGRVSGSSALRLRRLGERQCDTRSIPQWEIQSVFNGSSGRALRRDAPTAVHPGRAPVQDRGVSTQRWCPVER